MIPNDARLRNLTYSAPLYVDITKKVSMLFVDVCVCVCVCVCVFWFSVVGW